MLSCDPLVCHSVLVYVDLLFPLTCLYELLLHNDLFYKSLHLYDLHRNLEFLIYLEICLKLDLKCFYLKTKNSDFYIKNYKYI